MTEHYILAFSLASFLFLSIQLISSSNVIEKIKIIANAEAVKNHTYTKSQNLKRQRICILAGPHKTGTSSVQTNLYRWSLPTFDFSDSDFSPPYEPVLSWIWPVPPKIAEVEQNDTHTWNWIPSKVFYPMLEALSDETRHPKQRSLFQKYTPEEILQMYSDTIYSYWTEGHNIVFGTEAMDMIVKLPEGSSMLRRITQQVLPHPILGNQVTVVVMYRTPKIKHLISIWHQNCNTRTSPNFFEWITTTANTLGPMDSLGMVEMFLKETTWNVALIDLDGISKDHWDISNFVACEVLDGECKGKVLKDLHGSEPVITNVRSGQRQPNVSNQTLNEMDIILNKFDCNYQHLFQEDIGRLKVYYPQGLQDAMNFCKQLTKEGFPQTRSEMKSQVKDVALKYGKLEQ